MGIPILGICYGCQLMAYTLGGTVTTCTTSEYGKTETIYDKSSALFGSEELPEQAISWMSHTDYISEAPEALPSQHIPRTARWLPWKIRKRNCMPYSSTRR